MTEINSQDDFLRALEENPQWRQAVRALILGEEVLQLPVRFNAFMIRTEAFMERTEAFLADQAEFNRQVTGFMERTEGLLEQQAEFNRQVTGFMERTEGLLEQQAEFNRQVLVRFGRMESDIGNLKGFFAEYKVNQYAFDLVGEVYNDLEYVRTVPREEVGQMAQQAIAAGFLERGDRRSFVEADMVIEATDGAAPCYLAVEVSYTADRHDAERARRNARIITELRGCAARPVIASVRNDDELDHDIQSGFMGWYQITQQQMAH